MTEFSKMWVDVEDPGAGPDKAANARFVQGALDACTGRIYSGIYANEGALQRIVGDYQFPGYPYWRASDDGVADVNNRPSNGMSVTVEQFALDRDWDDHAVDINVRHGPNGDEYGVDLSNFSGVPTPDWFRRLADDPNFPIRFIVFGDQFPVIARKQIANAEASGRAFDMQLYTYINMPGGQFYAGRDGAQQMTEALDAMSVPRPSEAQQPITEFADVAPLIPIRAKLSTALTNMQGATAELADALRLAGG